MAILFSNTTKFEIMRQIQLLSSFLLIVLMVLPHNLTAQHISFWNGDTEHWELGNGTEEDPYLIENAQQLAHIATMVNSGETHFEDTWFKLTTDVYIDSLTNWNPIGYNTYYFSGHFDGDNHTITIYLYTSMLYGGIFGNVQEGSISNLNTAGQIQLYIRNSSQAFFGGICGIGNTNFINCHNTCNISTSSNRSGSHFCSGGICGYSNSNSNFNNCHNSGDIYTHSSNAHSGGICGRTMSASNFTDCHNTGRITTFSNYSGGVSSGGICGSSSSDMTHFIHCDNTGLIESSYSASSNSTNTSYSGGICGNSTATFIYCYNTGNISSYTYSGGICGYNCTVSHCYNTGNISSIRYAGGICGFEYGNSYNDSISNSYNVGTLSGNSYKGGICGYGGTITNCYYIDTCGHTATTGGTSLTMGQMKSPSFPDSLNADSVAFVNDIMPNLNHGYPIFGTVSTLEPNRVEDTTAVLNGYYQMPYDIDIQGFEYKKISDINYTTINTSGDSYVSYNVSGLDSNTHYTYRFFVQKDGVVFRGMDKTFTTSVCSLSVQITASTDKLCEGDTVTYSAIPWGSSGYQYIWSNGSDSSKIGVINDDTYTVTVTDARGCQATASKQMTRWPAAEATISGNNVLCNNSSTILTASGAYKYRWSTGSSKSYITVSSSGIYTCTCTNSYGCTTTRSIEVTIFTNPIIMGNTSFCHGEGTTLTANGGNSYLWNNGSTSSTINISQGGDYTVTATNEEGCSATSTITVIENPLPNIQISGNNSFCPGDSTILIALGANSYSWSNAITDSIITISSADTYTVEGTDANGCTNTASITVSQSPTYSITLTHSICEGETYDFHGQSLNTAGTYTHTLQSINGCDSVIILILTMKVPPMLTITGNTNFCQGQNSILTANGGNSYIWSNASSNNSISVSESGVYSVTATNTDGCSATAAVTVTVNPLPNVEITGNSTICQGGNTTLTATGADSYIWSTGENTEFAIISAFGIYTVTGTSIAGCSSSANITVLVSQLPVVTITGDTDICTGETTTLTAHGGETYLWSNGITDNIITVSSAGIYQVIGYNSAGCSSMADATINIWQHTTSEFSIECPEPCYIWNEETYCQSGDYTQTLQTNHGCDSVVTLHLTITVGVDNYYGIDFMVYPNPTDNIINIQFTNNYSPITEIRVYDMYGKILDVVRANNYSSMPSEMMQIDLSRFASGVYFIKALSDGNVIGVRKVLKQ